MNPRINQNSERIASRIDSKNCVTMLYYLQLVA